MRTRRAKGNCGTCVEHGKLLLDCAVSKWGELVDVIVILDNV